MIIWIVILLFLSIAGVLLYMPLRLVIDSKKDVYQVEWQHIGSALLVENDGHLGIQIRILFFKKTIPFGSILTKTDKRKVKNYSTKPLLVSGARMISKLKKILKSFEIKKCKVNWDTDDYILNAYLYPMTPFLLKFSISFIINFEGKREIELVIENRLGRIIKSFF